MTVAELGRRMSSDEFAGWIAYAAIEPFGPRREDLRAALVASILVNTSTGRDAQKYRPADFLGLDEQAAAITGAQKVADKARAYFAMIPAGTVFKAKSTRH